MFSLLMVVQILAAFTTIILVLLQQGKGADMGSAFGSGSAGSLFGASGAANFLSRSTKWAAVLFFAATAGLAYVSHPKDAQHGTTDIGGVMQQYRPQDAAVPQSPHGAASVPAKPSTAAPAPNPSVPSVSPSAPSSAPSSAPLVAPPSAASNAKE
jgi:preprotein translocase subunit SecG